MNAAMRVIGLPLWVGLWFAGIVAHAGQASDAAAAKAAFTQGRAAHDAGKADEAVGQTGALEPLLVLLMNAKRYDEGFALVDLRLAARPREPVSLYSLGRLASVSGQHLARGESALRRFLEVAGSNPISRANSHYRLGLIKEKLGDNSAAMVEYRAAIALQPRHSLAATALKNLERRQGDAK